MGHLSNAVQSKPVMSIKIAVLDFVKEGIYPIQTHSAVWRRNMRHDSKINSAFTQLYFAGQGCYTAHLQSIARPLGQPRVVFTIDRACDPSPQALIIFAGRYQSVQKIYLKKKSSINKQNGCNKVFDLVSNNRKVNIIHCHSIFMFYYNSV